MRKPLLFFLAVTLGVLVDLLSKKIIFAWLAADRFYPLIPDVLQLSLARNEGAAFSFLKEHPSILLTITIVMLGLLTWYYLRVWRTAHALLLVALGLLMTGAAGNLYDRLVFRYVRDFIDFMPTLPVVGHWAVFNIADVCITVGVGLYAVYALFYEQQADEKKAPASVEVQ